ncbi:MAG TPA: 2-oxoglutarate and iron-dependent oxygenase domain-containing protein [Stellaceae bacterium]|nr:2-oxoglutarate and iron-dependent oxygenase domain-containing protein [Stellaceae bacterium]
MADRDSIPVIDLGAYLAGEPGAAARAAEELRIALTEIGFYLIVNHGVAPALTAAAYREAARFHALPLDRKLAVKIDRHNVGYLPLRGDTLRTSVVETVTKANLNEAFFMARDLPPDHPDVVAGRRFRSANQWPAALPGFREALVAYCDALERLVRRLVPLYALALGLPAAYFDAPFGEPQYKLRATHYPPQAPGAAADDFGIAPHTDTSFLTLVAPNPVPGLAIRTQGGRWIAPPAVRDAFVVNGGQLLLRWTNDRFLATPHRAVNRSGGERYALAFFCDAAIDWPVAAVPSCVGPDHPPRYPTTYYTEYMIAYQQRTYNVFADTARDAAG